MQVGHILGSNAVQREFHTNSSKGTLRRKALNNSMKTIIKRRVTEFCKSTIFCVKMGLSDIFTVRPSNCRSDDKQKKQAGKDYFKASDSVLEIGYFSGSNRVQRQSHPKSSKM